MKASMYNMELDIEHAGGSSVNQQPFIPSKTPYDVDEHVFPVSDTTREQFLFLLRYAVLAPSSHNTQPWKFRLTDEGIAIHVDYSRRLPVADPGNRELVMGIGAAITNLRVAAARFGFACRVEYDQNADGEKPVAFAFLSRSRSLSSGDHRLAQLFPAIAKRHTNRQPFLMARIPDQLIAALNELATSSMASLFISRDGALNQRVADLVGEADLVQQADPSFRKEMAEWIRPNYTRKADGITGASLGVSDVVSVIHPWAMRRFDLGRLRAAKDKNLCLEAPGLLVIHSEDSLLHWIEVGEVLERVLLGLTLNGVQFSFFNMLIQVPDLRTELRSLLKIPAWPQLLLRIGYCLTESALSPRRPLEEVLITGDASGNRPAAPQEQGTR